ncbi:hypothetical protein BGW39_010507 [Mortierella sp. 14UC]|nr:hypothetical protein BGW39_010507 [Mortierella sp. 14UC]
MAGLCFSCPSSIVQLHIGETSFIEEEYGEPDTDAEHDDLEDENDDGDSSEAGQGMTQSTEPLSNLCDLELEAWDNIGTEEELLSVFKRCPRLEKISVRWSLLPAGVDGADIGRICSNLLNISYNGQSNDDDEVRGFWPVKIMGTLTENQVKCLHY